MNLESFRQICKKYLNIFQGSLSSESQLFHAGGRKDGKTEKHIKSNSRFSQFCEHP